MSPVTLSAQELLLQALDLQWTTCPSHSNIIEIILLVSNILATLLLAAISTFKWVSRHYCQPVFLTANADRRAVSFTLAE